MSRLYGSITSKLRNRLRRSVFMEPTNAQSSSAGVLAEHARVADDDLPVDDLSNRDPQRCPEFLIGDVEDDDAKIDTSGGEDRTGEKLVGHEVGRGDPQSTTARRRRPRPRCRARHRHPPRVTGQGARARRWCRRGADPLVEKWSFQEDLEVMGDRTSMKLMSTRPSTGIRRCIPRRDCCLR